MYGPMYETGGMLYASEGLGWDVKLSLGDIGGAEFIVPWPEDGSFGGGGGG